MNNQELALSLNPILENGVVANYNPEYVVYIHTPNRDITPITFMSIDTLRDYNESIAEYIVVEVTLAAGDFYQYVYPYKDTLEISIRYNTGDYDYSVNRYKMVLMNQISTDADLYNNMTVSELNTTELKILTCQCIDKQVEALRHLYADGIYKNTKFEDIICSSMIKNLDLATVEGSPLSSEMKFDVYPVDNTMNGEYYEQVIVPTGTKLIDLPSYLQNDSKYGLYNANVGTFFQKIEGVNTYFVYPLYDTKRVNEPKEGYTNQKRLVVVIPDTHLYDYSERTYIINGDEIRILAGKGTKLIDTGENELIDSGDGYVVSKPVSIMSSNVSITDTEVRADQTEGMESIALKERRDGVDGIKYIGNNSNIFKVRSDYIKATLAKYQITWNHCNMDILYPGMPVMIIKASEKYGVESIPGVLQATYSRYNNAEKTIVGILSIVAEKQAVYRELEEQ